MQPQDTFEHRGEFIRGVAEFGLKAETRLYFFIFKDGASGVGVSYVNRKDHGPLSFSTCQITQPSSSSLPFILARYQRAFFSSGSMEGEKPEKR